MPISHTSRFFAGLALVLMMSEAAPGQDERTASWWGDKIQQRLDTAETNRAELVKALQSTPAPRRDGILFLIENMPDKDLRTLSGAYLVSNVNLAYEAWETSPWRSNISTELFLNDVLPYASLNEARDESRAKLRELSLPFIVGITNPGAAAHLLNQKLFPMLKVGYNTGRRRPHQSPTETMASGKATCTGLSILLVAACRSVGIPARVTGTPMWANQRGNHTWVEIWDNDWHFAGAAEPDGAGLNRGWFVGNASQARQDEPRFAIYSTSFRKSDIHFPLVWAPGDRSVGAVNVTDRYAKRAERTADNRVRLAIKVVDARGARIVANLSVQDSAKSEAALQDKSRGESADLNDLATFELKAGHEYRVRAEAPQGMTTRTVNPTRDPDQLVTLVIGS